MIPRPQHFGDRAPFPCNRPGIVRIFEEPRLEALLLSAGGRAHYPGKQPHASIEDDHRAELTAGEHIVADRHRFERPRFEDSLVESLEAAAQEDHALARPPVRAPDAVSAARHAASSRASAGRRRRCRAPRRARPAEAPSLRRRRRACRQRCDACRSRSRGCCGSLGSRSPDRALDRQGSSPTARETSPGKA